jgi:hypothetical protein
MAFDDTKVKLKFISKLVFKKVDPPFSVLPLVTKKTKMETLG